MSLDSILDTITKSILPAGMLAIAANVCVMAEEVVEAPRKPTLEQVTKGTEINDNKENKAEDGRDYVKEFQEKLKDVKIPELKDASAYNNAGHRAMRSGDLLQAAKLLYRAMELDSEKFSVYMNLGTVYCKLGEQTRGSEVKMYLSHSLDLYNTCLDKISKTNYLTETQRNENLTLAHEGKATILYALGDKVHAKDSILLAAKYGKLTEKGTLLYSELNGK